MHIWNKDDTSTWMMNHNSQYICIKSNFRLVIVYFSLSSIFCANIKIPYYLLNGFFVILWKKEKLKNGESEIRRHKICMFYFDHKGKIFFLIGVSSTKLFIRKLRVKNIPYKNFYAWRSHIYLKVLYPIKLKKSHYSVQCISTHIYIAYLQKIQISKVPKLWTLIPTFLLKKNDKKVWK